MRPILTWLLAALALFGASAAQAEYPARPEGPVLDAASIIPDAEETALDARLREYNQRTGRALVVATVPSLDGETIELYAVKLFEAWGIGGKETDQGLLLLVAPSERKVRFETGYGLHAIFPDVYASRIIRGEITPRFKQGDMPGGINAGIDAAMAQLDRNPAEAKAVAEAAAAAEAARGKDEPSGGAVVFWIMMILFFMLMFGRRRRGYRRSGIDPGIVLWGVSEILHHANRGGGGFDFGGGGGGDGFGGFGGGGSGGGGASGSW